MSEVDRVSNSGLYPALPIADRRSSRDDRERRRDSDSSSAISPAPDAGVPEAEPAPRPPKSLIDTYA